MWRMSWECGHKTGTLDELVLQFRWLGVDEAICFYEGTELLLDRSYWDLSYMRATIKACMALIQQEKLGEVAEVWKVPPKDWGEVWLMEAHITSAIRAKVTPVVEEVIYG